MSGRSYGDAERVEAIGLAMTLGSREASRRTGVPRRTISYWLGKAAQGQQLAPIIEMTQRQMAERMWRTLSVAVDRLDATLADPKARLGDVAKATEILLNAHRLLSGQSTGNLAVGIGEVGSTDSVMDEMHLTPEQRRDLASALRDSIELHDTLDRLSPGLAERANAEIRAIGEKYRRIAKTGEVPELGPGDEVPEPTDDAPLTAAEKEALLIWAKATGRL